MEPMDCGRTTFQRYATVFSIQPSLASDTFKVKWFAVAGFALDTEDMIGEWKDDVTISFRQHRLQDLQKSLEIIKNTLDDLEDNYVKFAME